jgi:hypothetical protein
MAIRNIVRASAQKGFATATAAPIRIDTSTNTPFYNGAGSGSTEKELVDVSSTQTLTGKTVTPVLTTITGDGAVTIASGTVLLTKGSAAAITVAAPGTAGIGARITIVSGSNFAHVVTFTGGTLGDGTTGLNTTVTMTAFIGSSITVIANTATQWVVESQNNLTSIA